MSSLPTPLRRQLAATVQRARIVAENGARNALHALAVHEAEPYPHMNDAQRKLRRQLRAQARQLGDIESRTKWETLELSHLTEKLAYDQWHRLLFARFLLENNLLISPEHQVSVSLDDCEELARAEGLRDAWAVAAFYAAKELPGIFRPDDPAGAVDLPVEDRVALISIVTALPAEVFTADDSLGWCYQFWQADKKDEVNESGVKIGADELPAVTQLFTENYMVDFLLDNTLGAWHASKVLAANPRLAETARDELELRSLVALPACEWKFLRFVQIGGRWTPAAGPLDGWPTTARSIRALDPCMGSGHFITALFQRLVSLRIAEEGLDEIAAVTSVIRENIFGLELDPRCTQIAAFNLAFAAWRRVGYFQLPPVNLACSGLSPNASIEDWLVAAGRNERLRSGLERLYRLFEKAAVLGSLIDPRAMTGDLLMAEFEELMPLLERALEREAENEAALEMTVTARGLAKAAEILASRFTLVATNVPYLGLRNQSEELREFCGRYFEASENDLATVFISRSLQLLERGGSAAVVSPLAWLHQKRYEEFRRSLLDSGALSILARLGSGAFETISGEVVKVSLAVLRAGTHELAARIVNLDASVSKETAAKAQDLQSAALEVAASEDYRSVPEFRIVSGFDKKAKLLAEVASILYGQNAGDNALFNRAFWEVERFGSTWRAYQLAPEQMLEFSGRSQIVRWEEENGMMARLAESVRHLNHKAQQWRSGKPNWGKRGVAVSLVGRTVGTLYDGDIYGVSCGVIIPKDIKNLPAIWEFIRSGEFETRLREIDSGLAVSVKTVLAVPFDLERWSRVSDESYPEGLPKPFSSDPTQWLFSGHPAESDQPLHVAVARLLGYQWPRQTGSNFLDCPAFGPDGLETLADDDGIVPISPIKGEGAAAERLRELLARAYGSKWNATLQEQLVAQVDYAGASLEDWLRNGFFEQHCALFHQRPFIWHIWDGRKDGFSVLVNYHKLTHANLEKLTFAYLGDWIRRQQAAVEAGEAGSDARLQAAKQLQARLKLILDGEPPFDIFVRWKPLAEQAIGWHSDINDGVRMNIRPFMAQDIAGGKKGAGILRAKPNIKWEKDRGTEPVRDRKAYPWFWGWDGQAVDFVGVGTKPDGNRWNACHFTNAFKQRARDAEGKK